jgi:hypothetical protein
MPNSAWLLTQPVMTSASFVRPVDRQTARHTTDANPHLRSKGKQELGVGCYRTVARPQCL